MSEKNELSQETIESLAEMRLNYVLLNWRDNLDNTRVTPQDVAKSLIKILKDEFGYRPQNLTLISDEEIDKAFPEKPHIARLIISKAQVEDELFIAVKAVAQAQLDHCRSQQDK